MGCPFDASTGSATAGSGDAILPSTGSGTAWEGAQGPRRGIAGAEHVEAQGPRRGRDLSDGQKKETRGVEPQVSDDYYCSAGLSVSIGQ